MGLLSEVKERLSLFIGLYDHLRIVDPREKVVIESDGTISEFNKSAVGRNCYDIWGQGGMCKNCVSYRALYGGRSTAKIERNGDELYWTFATPVEYEGKSYVVEFLKKITHDDKMVDSTYKGLFPMNSTALSLNEMANTDALTGVYNRRYIDSKLERELEHGHFYQEDLSILLIDIDYFKQINDQYGHLVGDKILIEFAKSMMQMLRQDIDWMGRYGGEEFIVVLNRTSINAARMVAERIRYHIESEVFKVDRFEIKLTCSIGIASNDLLIHTVDEFIEKADQNLYRAKVNGRNQVVAI